MTAALPVAPEVVSAHCFNMKCRVKRDWVRVLASKPVFNCTGCGGSREIEELGRHGLGPAMAPRRGASEILKLAKSGPGKTTMVSLELEHHIKTMPPSLKSDLALVNKALAKVHKPHWLSRERRVAVIESRIKTKSQENPMKKTLVQTAIEAAVGEATAPILEKIKELEAKIEASSAPEILRAAIESVLLEQLGAAAPARAAAGTGRTTSSPSCPRHPHKGKCPSKYCENAKAKAAKKA